LFVFSKVLKYSFFSRLWISSDDDEDDDEDDTEEECLEKCRDVFSEAYSQAREKCPRGRGACMREAREAHSQCRAICVDVGDDDDNDDDDDHEEEEKECRESCREEFRVTRDNCPTGRGSCVASARSAHTECWAACGDEDECGEHFREKLLEK